MRGNDKDDSSWMGSWGECKICQGEIPYGHTETCFIYKCERTDRQFREALEALLKRYVTLVESGDAGNWNCEEEPEVIFARNALKEMK
jgi:hypothetical protein